MRNGDWNWTEGAIGKGGEAVGDAKEEVWAFGCRFFGGDRVGEVDSC